MSEKKLNNGSGENDDDSVPFHTILQQENWRLYHDKKYWRRKARERKQSIRVLKEAFRSHQTDVDIEIYELNTECNKLKRKNKRANKKRRKLQSELFMMHQENQQ